MFIRLSCWINSLISLALVVACLIFMPKGLDLLHSGGVLGVFAPVVVYPLMIIGGIFTALSVLSALFKSIISRRWYLISINVFITILAVICVLTCFDVLPSVV